MKRTTVYVTQEVDEFYTDLSVADGVSKSCAMLKGLQFYMSNGVKNARRAGRKSIVSTERLELIRELRSQGDSFKTIADKVGVSKTLVSNIINEKY